MGKILKNIDQSNIRKAILDFPKQFRVGIKSAESIKSKRFPKNLFILGMGGSALPGEILKIYFEKNKISTPLFLIQDYMDLFLAKEKDLIVAISYSGNTEETISAFLEAKKRKLSLTTITSGGKLAEISQKEKINFVRIPAGLPPRFALGYLFSALYQILINSGVIRRSSEEILKLEKELKPEKLEKRGKILAKALKNKIPIVYASRINFPLAKIWKIKFNENAKIPAFCNFFPELNHNEMVGFTKILNYKVNLGTFSIVMIRDAEDHPRNKKRMNLTEKILKEKGVEIKNIWLEGKSLFEKIFSNLLLADWVSFYLALIYKIDPAPVQMVEEFKKLMEK